MLRDCFNKEREKKEGTNKGMIEGRKREGEKEGGKGKRMRGEKWGGQKRGTERMRGESRQQGSWR